MNYCDSEADVSLTCTSRRSTFVLFQTMNYYDSEANVSLTCMFHFQHAFGG